MTSLDVMISVTSVCDVRMTLSREKKFETHNCPLLSNMVKYNGQTIVS